MFCALSSTGSTTRGVILTIRSLHHVNDLFTGDSGGPVFIPHRFNNIAEGKPNLDRLVGITSFGVSEENGPYPGSFRFVCSIVNMGNSSRSVYSR